MVDPKKPEVEIEEIAGGWITEKRGTGVPAFLKLTYVVVTVAILGYLYIYMNGEVNNDTRGALVQEFNRATGTANPFMFFVIALVVIYAVITILFAIKKAH